MLIHFSQLCYFALPVIGIVAPFILWLKKKGQSPLIDRHGRVVANWIFSALIYGVAVTVLHVAAIGIPLLIALCVAFPILGGVKANAGKVWKYPLSIPFFSTD